MQSSLHGPVIWKVMQRNVWSDIASWRTKKPRNCTKLQLHALIDDHHFNEEDFGSVGEMSQVCSQNFLKCQHLASIGRPDIPWSVNKLARSHQMDQSL